MPAGRKNHHTLGQKAWAVRSGPRLVSQRTCKVLSLFYSLGERSELDLKNALALQKSWGASLGSGHCFSSSWEDGKWRKDAIMQAFKEHQVDVLNCLRPLLKESTLPNAAVMVIMDAIGLVLASFTNWSGWSGKQNVLCYSSSQSETDNGKQRMKNHDRDNQ